MGIKNLNRFLKEHCANSIQMIHFDRLRGKTIVIDTSIYMYKFVSENALIENIYLMLSIFQSYEIHPIFVFDGKPPDDKLDLLKQRRMDKLSAEQEYELLKKLADDNPVKDRLVYLKKQFTYITKQQIADVKTMICSFNARYIEAIGESDEVCAEMVINGAAYAVMSEDMDMFVYGCPYVMRYTSLLNHTSVLYDLKGILADLGVSQKELREICVLSGTDYYSKNLDLYSVLKLFKKFHKQKQDYSIGFYDWLKLNGNLDDGEYDKASLICSRFELNNVHYEIMVAEEERETETMNALLKEEGFIFPINPRMDKSCQKLCL